MKSGPVFRKSFIPTLIFIAFLMFAGVLQVLQATEHRYLNAFYFCLHFLVLTGLLLFWTQSVRRRLLPSRSRDYLLAAAATMIFFLVLRTVKYRIATNADMAFSRWLWYGYYIPVILIPTLFLMNSIRVASEGRKWRIGEEYLLIPAGLMTAAVLTNDLHHLVFAGIPGVAFSDVDGTYSHGLLFFVIYAVIGIMIISGTVILVRMLHRPRNIRRALIPVMIFCMWIFLLASRGWLQELGLPRPFNMPEISIFCLLAVFESCIQCRMIPFNENYAGFFAGMRLPVVITDRNYEPVYISRGAAELLPEGQDSADKELLKRSLKEPVYLDPDLRISGQELRSGYAFWGEDESRIRRIIEKLADANEMIEDENELIRAENEIRKERARIESRNRIYAETAEELYPYQQRIGEMLKEAEPGTAPFKDMVARVSVLNAYVKRRTNLLFLASEQEEIDGRELRLALEESARYLRYVGVQASIEQPAGETYPSQAAIALYDAFEQIAEQLIGRTSYLMVSPFKGGMRLTAETEFVPDFSNVGLPVLSEISEGVLYVSVAAGTGGAS